MLQYEGFKIEQTDSVSPTLLQGRLNWTHCLDASFCLRGTRNVLQRCTGKRNSALDMGMGVGEERWVRGKELMQCESKPNA